MDLRLVIIVYYVVYFECPHCVLCPSQFLQSIHTVVILVMVRLLIYWCYRIFSNDSLYQNSVPEWCYTRQSSQSVGATRDILRPLIYKRCWPFWRFFFRRLDCRSDTIILNDPKTLSLSSCLFIATTSVPVRWPMNFIEFPCLLLITRQRRWVWSRQKGNRSPLKSSRCVQWQNFSTGWLSLRLSSSTYTCLPQTHNTTHTLVAIKQLWDIPNESHYLVFSTQSKFRLIGLDSINDLYN